MTIEKQSRTAGNRVTQLSDDRADLHAGTGSCTLCDCPQFIPSQGGTICINRNSTGGTCAHRDSEHND